jgi:hypothetical protein
MGLGDIGRADNREETRGVFGVDAHGDVLFSGENIGRIGRMLKCETSQTGFCLYFPGF